MTSEQKTAALAMLRAGEVQSCVAAKFGVTRNTIAGLWKREGDPVPLLAPPTTLFDRCDALHARLDAVLAATVGIGRVPDQPKL